MAVVKERTYAPFTLEGKTYGDIKETFRNDNILHLAGNGILVVFGKSESHLDKATVIAEGKVISILGLTVTTKIDFMSKDLMLREVSQSPLAGSRNVYRELLDSLTKFVADNPQIEEWIEKPAPKTLPILK